MKKHSGEIRLGIACLCSTLLILYGGYRYFTGGEIELPLQPTAVAPVAFSSAVSSKTEASDQAKTETDKKVANSTSSDKGAKTVAAKGKVKGKVTAKFFSPYTANTAYDSIYIKNSSGLKIDIKKLLKADLPYKIQKNSDPQILIVHTHTTESFLSDTRDYYTDADEARSRDNQKNVVALGNIMTEKLNAAGYKTVHDTTAHDYPAYNGSYDRAKETIQKNLKKYPSIKIVIDLHRDAIAGSGSERIKPLVEIDHKNAAQVMLVMGSQSGGITAFPKWQENLKLAVRFQKNMEDLYPGLARSISLMSRLYNENLTTGSILLEVGTEVNSLEEVTYSASLAADALIATLNAEQ